MESPRAGLARAQERSQLKNKELAMSMKLDKDVARGKSGVALGAAQESRGSWAVLLICGMRR